MIEGGSTAWDSVAGELVFDEGQRQQELTAEALKALNRRNREQQPGHVPREASLGLLIADFASRSKKQQSELIITPSGEEV